MTTTPDLPAGSAVALVNLARRRGWTEDVTLLGCALTVRLTRRVAGGTVRAYALWVVGIGGRRWRFRLAILDTRRCTLTELRGAL